MDKKYQIFISSTYEDLKEERRLVSQAVLDMGHIPTGMEQFPAIDEEQFSYIKRIIDNCDYYILIIGGRYGTPCADGVSYTEKEFDYAKEKGINIISFIHSDPGKIIYQNSEQTEEGKKKLADFIKKATTGRLVKYWEETKDLIGLTGISLGRSIQDNPAVGWIRANTITNPEAFQELNEVRKELQRTKDLYNNLKEQISRTTVSSQIPWINEETELRFEDPNTEITYRYTYKWSDILFSLLTACINEQYENALINTMGLRVLGLFNEEEDRNIEEEYHLVEADFKRIKTKVLSEELIIERHSEATPNLPIAMGSNITTYLWKITAKGAKLLDELNSNKD